MMMILDKYTAFRKIKISIDNTRFQCGGCSMLPTYGPYCEKTCLRRFANNKGADQPEHPRSLTSAFVIRFISEVATNSSSVF